MNEEEEEPATTLQSTMTDDPIAEIEQKEIADAEESAEDNNPSSADGITRCLLNFKIEKENLRYKIEALLRHSIAFAMATSLSVFGIGVVVPDSMVTILPFLTAALTFIFPTLQYTILGLHPGFIGFFFILAVFTTVLLAAATVSDGLFVAVYAILVFMFMGAFFDNWRGVSPLVLLMPGYILANVGMYALSYKDMVVNGPSFDFMPGEDTFNLIPPEIAIVEASSIFLQVNPASDVNISFVCPEETGLFFGQTCTITNSTSSNTDPGMLTASVNGGLYMVAAFWTERGLSNPFAFVSNFMIGCIWADVCIIASILFIPPVRSIRNLLRKFIIPGTLEGVASLLESFSNPEGNTGNCDVVNPFISDRDKLRLMEKEISPKDNVGMLVLEPRLCSTADDIPHMETLLQYIRTLLLMLFNYRGYHKASGIEEPDHSENIKLLRTMASAVRENNVSILNGVDVPSSNWDGSEEQGRGLPDMPLSGVFEGVVSSIYFSCRTWLDVYNNDKVDEGEKSRANAMRRSIKASVDGALCSCGVIIGSWPFLGLRLVLHRQGASMQNISTRRLILTLLWSAKWTAGAVALLCLAVYTDYSDFIIGKADASVKTVGVLKSWELIGYFMALQFSMEGTVKKGLMRMFGTLLGGFGVWIGLMLCSWSYNGTQPVNPYAWIAYLTVCQFFNHFHGKGVGVTAFLGMEYNTPFIAFYFDLTLNLVGMTAFFGIYSTNAGVAQRILANLVGIGMAMLVSMLPPYYTVKDPRYTIEYCEEIQKFHYSIAREYLETHDVSRETINQMEDDIGHLRRKAELILNDGGRWGALPLPCFRQPPGLKKILDILIAEEGYLIWIFKLQLETNFYQSQNHDIFKPAMEEVLEGKGKTSPAIKKYLNEAGERNSRHFVSFLNRIARLQVLHDELESFSKPAWYNPF